MKNINSGAEFLNLVFKDMKDSIKSESNDPAERITEYLDRLERIHGKVSDENKRSLLKSFYYDKYIIKSLPESYIKYRKGYFNDLGLEDKECLTDEDLALVLGCIKYDQKKSLDNWLDFLCDEENTYPTWFKYYIFQGVTKVGSYYSAIGDFTKRSSSTTDPFIPVEPQVISRIYSLVSKYLTEEPLTEEEQKITSSGLNFRNLYSNLYREHTPSLQVMPDFADAEEHIGPAIPDYDISSEEEPGIVLPDFEEKPIKK